MKVYLSHSSGYAYEPELYVPLKASLAKQYDIFFPHDDKNGGSKSKDVIANCDVVLAEVSYPSTGQGIELGWADTYHVPIVCFYKFESKLSSSLPFISDTFLEYESREDMVQKLGVWLDKNTL